MNENPVSIIVKNLRKPLPSLTTLVLLGVENGNSTVLSNVNSRFDWAEIWQEVHAVTVFVNRGNKQNVIVCTSTYIGENVHE